MSQDYTSLEQAVLQVLTGVSLQDVEQKYAMDRSRLLTGVEVYRAAGLQGLVKTMQDSAWYYWRIPMMMTNDTHFTRREDEALAADIGPLCGRLVAEESIARWWFMRKADQGPHIRLRVFGQEPVLTQEAIPRIEAKLVHMEEEQRIQHWTKLTYEPETMLFGGPEAIEFAHDLFYRDSVALCQWLDIERQEIEEAPAASTAPTAFKQKLRPEASLLVIQQLLRGAGLDAFEQWDVWVQVTKLRPGATTVSPEQRQRNITAFNSLLTASKTQREQVFGEPLSAVIIRWAERFEEAGRVLAQLHRDGVLQRGLRQILAAHIIFHWNRFNFGAARQIELASMAEMRARR